MTAQQVERLIAALERIADAMQELSPEEQAERQRVFARVVAEENQRQASIHALKRQPLPMIYAHFDGPKR